MPPILFVAIIGAAAGFLATRVMKVQTDVPMTVVIGMAGAVVGWLALRILFAVAGWTLYFIGAVLGAMALIWAWKEWGPKGRR
jgi:uncharacterized membrane protein YeaQ/YmgE (transglycosylase-associated protein family)